MTLSVRARHAHLTRHVPSKDQYEAGMFAFSKEKEAQRPSGYAVAVRFAGEWILEVRVMRC